MPDELAISVASLVQSANAPPSFDTSESNDAAPVTRSPSLSKTGNVTLYATAFCGTGLASPLAI
uniref:Uncharacterized protein n=1 Tax=uncultured marine virus TaxID=186617 RepID=A0A0F7L459_9VIRU|nr:hypothetical protein [uncultured marine virus]